MLTRATCADLSLRDDAAGRTVYGYAVRWDEADEITEGGRRYVETWRRGAFARTLADRGPERVKVLALHDQRRWPLGRLAVGREDGTGLYVEARLSRTRDADEALELVGDGVLDAFSIGFVAYEHGERWSTDRRSVERVEAGLREVSLVAFPALAGALVSGVRSASSLPAEAARRRLAMLARKF